MMEMLETHRARENIMPSCRFRGNAVFLVATLVLGTFWGRAGSGADIDFNREIRPILSDKCFACHGPNADDREGGFRLDEKESALGEADSGEPPVVPGRPDESELVARITADDDSRMPPPESGKSLNAREIALLREWIAQGAPWRGHWP